MKVTELLAIALGAILTNNFIFSQFLGICPFMGVSKKIDTAVGMGAAVTFVMGLASALCYPVNKLLDNLGLGFMQTVAFILVIAGLVQFVEMFLQKAMPSLYQALGIYLPLLVVEPLLTYRFGRVQETVRKAVSKGLRITVGYALLLVLLGCVREWLAAGTMFGVVVSRPVLPMASMPAGGFIVLGVLCAVWRALAQKRKAYLTKEARNLVDVHSQKEADREQ